MIEDALHEALARGGENARREHVPLPTFRGKGLRPGVDLDSTASPLELMEEEAAR